MMFKCLLRRNPRDVYVIEGNADSALALRMVAAFDLLVCRMSSRGALSDGGKKYDCAHLSH